MKPWDLMRRFRAPGSPGGGGIDPYWSDVVSLLHLDGSNGSTTFTDEKGVTWSPGVNGSPTISTALPRFGSGALDLPQVWGAGGFDSIDAPSTLITANTGADAQLVTIEAFAYVTTLTGYQSDWNPVVGQVEDIGSGDQMLAIQAGYLRFYRGPSHSAGGVDVIGATLCAINTWYHCAMTYDGTDIRIFLDGNLEGTIGAPAGWAYSSQPVKIGMNLAPTFPGFRLSLVGRVDEFRVTRNQVRYVTSFTPPSAPFPNN